MLPVNAVAVASEALVGVDRFAGGGEIVGGATVGGMGSGDDTAIGGTIVGGTCVGFPKSTLTPHAKETRPITARK